MAVRRFKATKDNTITNAFKENLTTRGTTANMGQADVLEVFSIYGQATTSSGELSRVLIEFDLDTLSASRDDGNLPASGSVDFYLRMFNAEHTSTTPTNFTLSIAAISQSWDEGDGLDMEDYSDPGIGNGGQGSTWLTRKAGSFSDCSLELNGSDEYVQVADNNAFSYGDGANDNPFSLSAWINIDSLSDHRPIITKRASGQREWQFFVLSTGQLYLEFEDETVGSTPRMIAQSPASSIATGRWYHVAATYDGRGGSAATSGMKLYINGVSQTLTLSTDANYVAMANTTAPVQIGAMTVDSNFFDGKIDEISVWNKELSSTQVLEIYNEGVPNNLVKTKAYTTDATKKLVAWWQIETDANKVIDVDTTSTIRDRSGNGHNGTGNGLATSNFSTTDFAGNGVANAVNTALYWLDEGGRFSTGSQTTVYSQTFETGLEDLEVDVTHQVEEWLNNNTASFGFGVFLTSSLEATNRSYYTKKFFARDSQFLFKRPTIEARWNNSKSDDAANFYLSSSRAPAADNLNTLYFYNYVRGQLQDPPGLGFDNKIFLSLYESSDSSPTGNKIQLPKGGGVVTNNDGDVTGSKVSTGIFSASFAYNASTKTQFHPVWHSGSTEYLTGSIIEYKTFETQTSYPTKNYKVSMPNLQAEYGPNDIINFRVFVQDKEYHANIYTVASTAAEPTILEKMYYRISRVVDEEIVVDYGTGSGNASYSQLSYDVSGNYFDFDIGILEPDFSYEISYLVYQAGNYSEIKDKFNFRVIDENDLPG